MSELKEAHAYLSKEQQRELPKIQSDVNKKYGEGNYIVLPAYLFQKEIKFFSDMVREYQLSIGKPDEKYRYQAALNEKACLGRLEILNESTNHKIWDSASKRAKKIRSEQ